MIGLRNRWIVASGIVFALSGQVSPNDMTLAERVYVADFIGVVRIPSVHPTPNAGKSEEQREGWFLQTADAEVVETIKGISVPSHIMIHFDTGHPQDSMNVIYSPKGEYFVFLSFELGGGYSTCVKGQYAIRDATISGWQGSAGPVALDAARDAITKLLPRKRDA